MLDGLGKWLTGLVPDADFGDKLAETMLDVLSARVAPIVAALVAETRRVVLESTRPEPPSTYAVELRKIAPSLRDEQISELWDASWRAICADRPQQNVRPALQLIVDRCPDCKQPTSCYPHTGCVGKQNAG